MPFTVGSSRPLQLSGNEQYFVAGPGNLYFALVSNITTQNNLGSVTPGNLFDPPANRDYYAISDSETILFDRVDPVDVAEEVGLTLTQLRADMETINSNLQSQITGNDTDILNIQVSLGQIAFAGILGLSNRIDSLLVSVNNLLQFQTDQALANTGFNSRISTLEAGTTTPPVPPQTTITSTPQGQTTDTTPTFTFVSAPTAGATFEVSIDTGTPSWVATGGGGTATTYTPGALSVGNYTFRVRATVGGQVDASPATESFAVIAALPVPDTVIDTVPNNPSTDTTPTFTYHASPSTNATYQVSVDTGTPSWATPSGGATSTSHTHSTLSPGFYYLRARSSSDGGSNWDSSPAVTTLAILNPTLYWQWDAASGTVHTDSATFISHLINDVDPVDGPLLDSPGLSMGGSDTVGASGGSYAVPCVKAGASDPVYTVPAASGSSSQVAYLDNPLRSPIFPSVNGVVGPATGTDGHLNIWDTTNNRMHDLYQAVIDRDPGSTTFGRILSVGSGCSYTITPGSPINSYPFTAAVNGGSTFPAVQQPASWTANAAGMPLRAGLITPEEINAGLILHTMMWHMPAIASPSGLGIWPATHNSQTNAGAEPTRFQEGRWIRLNPSYNVAASSLQAWEKTIATALQTYGAVLRDNAGTFGIYAEDCRNRGLNANNPGSRSDLADALLSKGAVASHSANAGLSINRQSCRFSAAFPWSQLQVLNPPPH